MTGTKHRDAASGVTVEFFWWGEYLVGDKASLQAHPRCPAGMFDGEGVTWKTSRTIELPQGTTAVVKRLGKRYRLHVQLSKEAEKARRNERARLTRVAASIEEAERQLRTVPDCSAAYRAEALSVIALFERLSLTVADGTFGSLRGGYMLHADDQNTVGIHWQAIRATFETGRVVFDPARRQEVIDTIMAPARTADPSFAKLLGGLTDGSQGPADD